MTEASPFEPRLVCHVCWRAGGTCHCDKIRPFEAGFQLVLVAHPKEARNRVGTLRITHRSVRDSLLVIGKGPELDADRSLRRIVADPALRPHVLFPGSDAFTAETLPPDPRKLVLFVIDGTWSQASTLIRTSRLLSGLPKIAFTPDRESEYEFRTQPKPHCLSTVEAVHTLIDRLDRAGRCPAPPNRAHDGMLEVFRDLVRFQVGCEREGRTLSLS